MSDYRRWYLEGGTYFFTVVTHGRRPILCLEQSRSALREAITLVQRAYPFEMPGIALLPDHVHAIWTLPRGGLNYSTRWRRIKEEFTKRIQTIAEGPVTASRRRRGERGYWQRRFWEHLCRDVDDFERHLDYIHYNPVKHGLVKSPKAWEYSSFHRWVRAGVYIEDWGAVRDGRLDFSDIQDTTGE